MEPSTLELMANRRDDIFVAPGPGVLWNTMHDPYGYGFDANTIEKMESAVTLEGTRQLIPQIRARGIRVLPGGDYGFPWNPVGCNALDHALFVSEYGFTPAETLHAATALGGEIMGMGDELGQIKPGFLADLLLVDGDPTKDITLLQDAQRILFVMKDGRICKQNGQLMAAS
jgi:imidazolonepropionase-like amidohydrolase